MQANHPDFMVFTGNANPGLAAEIAQNLGTSLGAARVGRFSDGEVTVEINQNVRARDVFVVQSTCAPTNENLMELLIMVVIVNFVVDVLYAVIDPRIKACDI